MMVKKRDQPWLPVADLAQVVRFHRRRAGLTQGQLALLADLGKTVVFDIEHGKRTSRFDTVQKMLAALNIRLGWSSPLTEQYRSERDGSEPQS